MIILNALILTTISNVKRHSNPQLNIDGILLTLVDGRTNLAKSKEIYLGKYEVQEITAPYGMVLNDEIHSVELVKMYYSGVSVRGVGKVLGMNKANVVNEYKILLIVHPKQIFITQMDI